MDETRVKTTKDLSEVCGINLRDATVRTYYRTRNADIEPSCIYVLREQKFKVAEIVDDAGAMRSARGDRANPLVRKYLELAEEKGEDQHCSVADAWAAVETEGYVEVKRQFDNLQIQLPLIEGDEWDKAAASFAVKYLNIKRKFTTVPSVCECGKRGTSQTMERVRF